MNWWLDVEMTQSFATSQLSWRNGTEAQRMELTNVSPLVTQPAGQNFVTLWLRCQTSCGRSLAALPSGGPF